MRWAGILVAVVLFCLAPAPVRAASAVDRFTILRAEKPFELDGTLSDPRWTAALRRHTLTNVFSRTAARSEFQAAVFYDDKNLYVGFRLQQSAVITATQSVNNIGFGIDDFIGIGVDPLGNGQRAYWFETTPRGVRYQQANENVRYLPVWQAQASVTRGGWTAMLIVPLNIMKIPSNGLQHWRINFERYIAATAERDSWAFDSLMANYPVANFPDFRESRWWPTIVGMVLNGVVPPPRPRAEIYALDASGGNRDVYTTVSGTTYTAPPRYFGIDASYPIKPTINLDIALSPDFSNVEVDQQTITPQQFNRNYKEYRPFFAQGAPFINTELEDYEFNFPQDQIFYSPSIGLFNRGVKLEGTQGINSFGVLEVAGDDPSGPQNFDDTAFGFLHKRPDNTLAVWADGVLAHHEGIHDSTLEFGAYGRSLASGLVYSFDHASEYGNAVTNPSQAQKTDALFDLQKAGPFEATVGWVDIGNQYNPIDGFTNIADVRGPDAQVDWVITPQKWTALKNYEFYLYADRWLDAQGQVHEADADTYWTIRTKKLLTMNFGYQNATQRQYGGNFYSGYYNNYANAVTQRLSAPFVGFTLGDGAPNSFNAQYQWGPFDGTYLTQIATTTIYQFGRRASLEFDYAATLERPLDGIPMVVNGQELRRLVFGVPLGGDGNASFAYRAISGTGGFAVPGKDLAFGVRKRFHNGTELFVNYGTPAASSTLDRLIVKYLVRVGGGL